MTKLEEAGSPVITISSDSLNLNSPAEYKQSSYIDLTVTNINHCN